MERVGNNGGEDWGLECEAESKPSGTVDLFRRIPPGVTKSVGKKCSRHRTLFLKKPASFIGHGLPTFTAENFTL